MAVKTISKCANCGYPLAAEYEGQTVTCPMCGTVNQAANGVTIPTWLFASGIGLAIGIIFGPVILGSTEAGARYLERRAREKLSR
jgi:phage FluMu protein Com